MLSNFDLGFPMIAIFKMFPLRRLPLCSRDCKREFGKGFGGSGLGLSLLAMKGVALELGLTDPLCLIMFGGGLRSFEEEM